MSCDAEARTALAIHVTGVVQGVGFRPFVHRLAEARGLGGWVRNESGEVRVVVEGPPSHLDAFVNDLRAKAPPLARIDSVSVAPLPLAATRGFQIVRSREQSERRQPVAADVAMCRRCEAELADPGNRRHRYPFITCTDCGPRYSVIEAMPYDRDRTSLRAFTQCPACQTEYQSLSDRRYHSETNCCPACGPRVWLEPARRVAPAAFGEQALRTTASLLGRGSIVAVRGVGGFHLAADATNARAVQRLRSRKGREAKPFAIMVRDLDAARALATVSRQEERLLSSRERPIVLVRAKATSPLAPGVAPGLHTVGLMLPSTPLHHLLVELADRPLVMTSGNRTEEPIAIANAAARTDLARVADAFLMHDREIVARCDDSVIRVVSGAPVILRRARGYAPLPLPLPLATPQSLVALGAHLKNTFTLAQSATAYVSPHVGDLDNVETLDHLRATLAAYRRLFHVEPRVAVRDLHPGYLSSRAAEELGLPTVMTVQHHHAHVAAVAAEHGVRDSVIGIAYDGVGYGEDGTVWGSEILTATLTASEGFGRLRSAPLPGGDLAARRPWRAALGYLSLDPGCAPAFTLAFEGIRPEERAGAEWQIAHRLNAPLASSMGRLFDAAAAVLGTRRVASYEGQAAMELEDLAGTRRAEPLPFPVVAGGGDSWIMDPLPLLVALGERRRAGDGVPELSARFHESIAGATIAMARRAREARGIGTVALGGGVFQNRRLLSRLSRGLRAHRFKVLLPRRLGPNDGAISYGQAAIAAARLSCGAERGDA